MSRVVRHGLALLRAPAIELGYALRASLRWSRGAPGRDRLADAPTFAWAPAPLAAELTQRAAVLEARFGIEARLAGLAPEVRARNFARLEQLERLAGGRTPPGSCDGVVRAADLGCGDFHYAAALCRWLSCAGDGDRSTVLRGLELDGHGIYRDGHSRADHGRAHARAASVDGDLVRFEVADAAAARLPRQDVVSLFFPFLSPYACLQWGAPLSRLRPRRLLARAVSSLRPGGWLVVANQTTREHARLCRLLAGLPVVRIARATLATDLVPEAPRTVGQIGSIWQRQEDVPSGMANG
jgi:SAM-dependent methyltransferase